MKAIIPFLNQSEGITISGGEPLDQKEALLSLLKKLNEYGVKDVLLYSGYEKEYILSFCPEIKNLIAALIDGAFVKGAVTSSHWKGSNNQTLTVFRDEFKQKYTNWQNSFKRKIQLIKKNNEMYLIGILRQNDNFNDKLKGSSLY